MYVSNVSLATTTTSISNISSSIEEAINKIDECTTRVDECLTKEAYIEDRAKQAIKERDRELHAKMKQDKNEWEFAKIIENQEYFEEQLSHMHTDLISIKNVTYDSSNNINSVIYFENLKIESSKKFSKFSKWLYKKLFGCTIENV